HCEGVDPINEAKLLQSGFGGFPAELWLITVTFLNTRSIIELSRSCKTFYNILFSDENVLNILCGAKQEIYAKLIPLKFEFFELKPPYSDEIYNLPPLKLNDDQTIGRTMGLSSHLSTLLLMGRSQDLANDLEQPGDRGFILKNFKK